MSPLWARAIGAVRALKGAVGESAAGAVRAAGAVKKQSALRGAVKTETLNRLKNRFAPPYGALFEPEALLEPPKAVRAP